MCYVVVKPGGMATTLALISRAQVETLGFLLTHLWCWLSWLWWNGDSASLNIQCTGVTSWTTFGAPYGVSFCDFVGFAVVSTRVLVKHSPLAPYDVGIFFDFVPTRVQGSPFCATITFSLTTV